MHASAHTTQHSQEEAYIPCSHYVHMCVFAESQDVTYTHYLQATIVLQCSFCVHVHNCDSRQHIHAVCLRKKALCELIGDKFATTVQYTHCRLIPTAIGT